MSRVGKYPVEVPAGVQVALAAGRLTVKGRMGELGLDLSDLVEGRVEKAAVGVGNQTVSNSYVGRRVLARHVEFGDLDRQSEARDIGKKLPQTRCGKGAARRPPTNALGHRPRRPASRIVASVRVDGAARCGAPPAPARPTRYRIR